MRDMRFIVCDVSKALGSVSQMCKAGHKVVFNPPWDPEGSYIQHVDIGECMWLEEHIGFYMINTKVAPASRQNGGDGATETMRVLDGLQTHDIQEPKGNSSKSAE